MCSIIFISKILRYKGFLIQRELQLDIFKLDTVFYYD
jgi:hypothetical protein